MATIDPSALLEFAKTLGGGGGDTGSKTKQATVTRVDKDGTAYVSIPGGVEETPIASTGVEYGVGDIVNVILSGGKLRISGNVSKPAISNAILKAAISPVVKAAAIARNIADEAASVANAVNQHFWTDDNGAHVTDITQDAWTKAAAAGFPDVSDSKPYPNLLMNSLGILLRSALNNLVSITRSAIAFYDGQGNNASNVVASFGTNGAQVGKSSNCVSVDSGGIGITNDSLKAVEITSTVTQYTKNGELEFIPDVTGQSGNPVSKITGGWTDLGSAEETSISIHAHSPLQTGATITLSSLTDGTSEIAVDASKLVWSINSNPILKVITASSAAQSITANNGKVVSISPSIPTGYTLIGIMAVNHSHNLAGSIGAFAFSGSTVSVAVTNRSGSNWTDEVVTVQCLCAWTGIV